MKIEQFVDKVKELNKANEQLLIQCLLSFIGSGIEDISSYDDNFELPKLFMCAFGKKITEQHEPLSDIKAKRRIVDNIYLGI